ncbi:MAG: AraC family transcriptional regulator [Spirochaetales bacterium]|nr:AraC family transcriptional regulator [Spirochaetales bacterium]
MWELFYFVFLIMGAAWALAGAGNLLLKKRGIGREKFSGLFVFFVFFVNILDNLIRPDYISRDFAELIYHVSRPSYLLVGPAFLFYVRSLLREKGKFGKWGILHFLPFLFWFVKFLLFPASLHPEVIFAGGAVPGEFPLGGRDLESPKLYWDVWKNVSLLAYTGWTFFLIRRHRKAVPDLYSSLDKYNTLAWLSYLLSFYLGIYLVNLILQALLPETSSMHQWFMALARVAPPVLFVLFFSLFSGPQQVVVPRPEEAAPEPTDRQPDEKSAPSGGEGKYEKSGLSEKESGEVFARLRDYLVEERVYLDPELNLEELALSLGETRHRLSEVINRESGEKFYRFINLYRLEEFKSAERENRYPKYTILSIALECGFRSQSAFYNLFKQEEGMTPRAYVLGSGNS